MISEQRAYYYHELTLVFNIKFIDSGTYVACSAFKFPHSSQSIFCFLIDCQVQNTRNDQDWSVSTQ